MCLGKKSSLLAFAFAQVFLKTTFSFISKITLDQKFILGIVLRMERIVSSWFYYFDLEMYACS
jgi:hypothetical protein